MNIIMRLLLEPLALFVAYSWLEDVLSCDFSREGFDSDCLSVEVREFLPIGRNNLNQNFDKTFLNFSFSTEQESIPGLYSTANFVRGDLLCEVKGELIPTSELYHLSALLEVKLPNGKKYSLQPTSACGVVQDCIISSSSRCNVEFRATSMGKLLLYASTDVASGEGIFASYGSVYWSIKHRALEVGGVPLLARPILDFPRTSSSVNTEDAFLSLAPTLLPISGVGLFAKYDIPAGEIICEYG